MKRTTLVYGLISGLVIIGTNTLSYEMGLKQAWLGFLVMFIAFSSIYVAVMQYRDEALGGVISFAPAFLMGLSISLVASIVYVLCWESYLMLTDYGFIDDYVKYVIESKRASGLSPEQMEQAIKETQQLKEQYQNPLLRLPMTLLEIFPVGFLISLVSALVLKNKGK